MKVPCILPGCAYWSKLFGSKSNDFENEALEIHNEYRREHGVQPLVLNKDISKAAQKWAEELAKRDQMAYSLNEKYGESVYCGWSADSSTKVTPRDCISKWYSEINEYNAFGKEPEVLNCGHFTQIVWKSTKELGIGHAKSKSGKLYVVANYYPPGNYSGQFAQNVPPPGALQFRSFIAVESNNNLEPPSPKIPISTSPRNSKNIGDIASNLIHKLKEASLDDSASKASNANNFDDEFIKAHNDYRREHGVPPLELSKKLSKYAEEWAKTLVKKDSVEHRQQQDYGENIYYAWSSDPSFAVSGKDPVDKWYSEIKYHVFGKEPTNLDSGHFTQVIWEDSKEVGVGVARSKEGKVYVVANYYPPGNVIGSFSTKVKRPT